MEGSSMRLREIKNLLVEREQDSITLLKKFVEMESFSHDKVGIDKLCSEIIKTFQVFPLEITVLKEKKFGNHLKITMGKGQRQITILSHLDTVYPKGTLDKMPFKVDGDKVYGPGVYDMKASFVMMYHLFDLLKEEELHTDVKLVWLLTSDEEIGSPTGRYLVYEESERSEAVLVLEPSADGGALKTARKGGGKYRIEVNGISAHSGINPEDGANAIEELARQIIHILGIAQPSLGTTINPGEITGGTLFNVVPDHASAEVDVRILTNSEAERIESGFRNLAVYNPKTHLKVEGSIYRPPMVRTNKTEVLFNLAKNIAEEIGVTLTQVTTGGGSDGNFAASRGTAVLDGLGVVGGFAHSPNEFLWKDSIVERTCLLYGIVISMVNKQHLHVDKGIKW
jgi:glutamate carboxypeptidase